VIASGQLGEFVDHFHRKFLVDLDGFAVLGNGVHVAQHVEHLVSPGGLVDPFDDGRDNLRDWDCLVRPGDSVIPLLQDAVDGASRVSKSVNETAGALSPIDAVADDADEIETGNIHRLMVRSDVRILLSPAGHSSGIR